MSKRRTTIHRETAADKSSRLWGHMDSGTIRQQPVSASTVHCEILAVMSRLLDLIAVSPVMLNLPGLLLLTERRAGCRQPFSE